MLRVSLHAGPRSGVCPFNQLALCDIGYEALAPVADYTGRYVEEGRHSYPPVALNGYPRWSASLWDLVARVLALTFHPDAEHPRDEMTGVPAAASGAFAECLSALIEHVSADETRRTTLASAEIRLVHRPARRYVGRFDEHTRRPVTTKEFVFSPAYLHPGELLMHACATLLTGEVALPPRPALCVPPALVLEGVPHIRVDDLVEPARTGFLRWCAHGHGASLLPGLAPEALYARFLREAL